MGWSALSALGEAAKGAGNYFGTLTSMKLKEERLAQARAEQVADRDEGREYAEGQLADKRAYSEKLTADDRTYKEEQDDLARKQNMSDWQTKQDAETEDKLELERLKKGPGGAGSDKSASQVTHETRTKQAEAAFGEAEAIMQNYNPGSAQGGWDQVMVGGATNFMASKEGQQYQAAIGRVKEAFLRAATGAAAPDSEQKQYTKMFVPQFGDGPETIKAKMAAMREQISIMQEAYPEGSDVPHDVRVARHEEIAAQTIEKYGLAEMSEANATQQEEAKFKAYQDERGNWVKTPPAELSIDDLLKQY